MTRAKTIAAIGLTAGAGMWTAAHLRSRAVQAWAPSAHPVEAVDGQGIRRFGAGAGTVVMLHGLGATADYWSAAYDQLGDTNRVVAIDLPGFGRSLDMERSHFRLDDHIAAVDTALINTAHSGPITVVAHSMGCGVALAWAARNPERVRTVICCGAPAYPTADAAEAAIAQAGPMARLFLLDPTWAERACAINCAHRTAAGLAAALFEPTLPVGVTRRASLHTWPAYRDAVQHLILDFDWSAPLAVLRDAGVPVEFLGGADDRIGDRSFLRDTLDQSIHNIDGAGHHLPITHSDAVLECVAKTPEPRAGTTSDPGP